MREKDLKEDLATLAYKAEADHEVQMARADLYKLAKYSIKLHEMMKGVTEQEGLEGWVQSKITKAADYIGSVYHYLDYETKFDEMTEAKKKMVKDPKTGKMVPNYAIDGKGKDDLTKKKVSENKIMDPETKKMVPEKDYVMKYVMAKHPQETKKLLQSQDLMDIYDTDLYMALFDYFSEDMPYGTQKGRDGDPVQYMQDELDMMGMFDGREGPFDIYNKTPTMKVSQPDKDLNTPAFQRMKAGDPRYTDDTNKEQYIESLKTKLEDNLKSKKKSEGSLVLEDFVGKSITEEQFDEAAGKKDACYHKVKSRYKVWPSAYASGAIAKCRKKSK